jgi:hypothetical protein
MSHDDIMADILRSLGRIEARIENLPEDLTILRDRVTAVEKVHLKITGASMAAALVLSLVGRPVLDFFHITK